jgi:hypothetical protein
VVVEVVAVVELVDVVVGTAGVVPWECDALGGAGASVVVGAGALVGAGEGAGRW